MAVVAVRGGTAISDDVELKAHLATLLRLENVAVFLGAGASAALGGKTMLQLWDDFVEQSPAAAKWLADGKFVSADAITSSEGRRHPNVEALTDTLEIARTEWRRQELEETIHADTASGELSRALVRAALLNADWWPNPCALEPGPEALQHHRSLLQKLVAARQPGQPAPWVFTSNYDLAIEWAAESIDLQVINGFIGLHGRRFSPQCFDLGFRNTQARGEARFGVYNVYLAKLHGSLNWREAVNGDVLEVQASEAWRDLKEFLENPKQTELGFLVMPRAAKYMQTTGYVVGELFRRFSEYLSRPQSCLLISGYGFGDEHINRILQSALLNPTLQVVIYFPRFAGANDDEQLPDALRRLLALKNPRVTVVGGGEGAYLDKLVAHLPEPLLYDDEMRRLADAIRDRGKLAAPSGGGDDVFRVEDIL